MFCILVCVVSLQQTTLRLTRIHFNTQFQSVPKGDWFCDRCKKEKEKQAKLLSPEVPTPTKKRRIFRDEDVEEEESNDSPEEELGEEEEELDEDMEVDEENPPTK